MASLTLSNLVATLKNTFKISKLTIDSSALTAANIIAAENKRLKFNGRELQNAIADGNIGLWQPPGGVGSNPGLLGIQAPNAAGSGTARTVATTNVATMLRRIGYVTNAAAGSISGHYMGGAQFRIGGAGSGADGFLFKLTFCVSDAATVAGARMFCGMSSATSGPSNVEPNTLTNCFGLAQLSTSDNLHIVYGGSAAQTEIDLGANFPAASNGTLYAYRLTLYAPSDLDNTVYYLVERLGTSYTASGTLTGTAGTVLPANTTLLAYRAWRCNNATALSAGIDIATVYFEMFL